MKYLLLFAFLYVAYVVWRNGRVAEAQARRPTAPPMQATPLEMVSCPVCGVHLPRSDAVPGAPYTCASPTRGLPGTCRSPASPRSWRTSSCT